MVKNNIFLLSEEKTFKALIKLGVPTMIGMMVSALYNIADTYFVSSLGTSEIGAVSVVYPLSVIIVGISILFGSGASSYAARLLGNKKYKEADRCVSTALFTSLMCGIISIMLMIIFINPMLRVLGATDTIFPLAKEYAVIFIIGLFFNVFNVTVNNIITCEGASMYSMQAMLCGGLLNIVLDPLLITNFGFGIKGAAAATLISRIFSFMIYMSYILKKKGVLHFSIKYFKPEKNLYIEILKIGVPMFVFQILMSISLSLTNFLVSGYGDSAVAAISVVSRMMSLIIMAIFGFTKGYQSFVGYNYGAGNMERVNDATRLSLKWTTTFCVMSTVIIIIFAKPIIGVFNKSDAMFVSIGIKSLISNAVMLTTVGFQAIYGVMFLALGKSKEGGLISIGRQGLFFIPLIFILALVFKLNGIIIGQPVADLCAIILVFILRKKYIINNLSIKTL